MKDERMPLLEVENLKMTFKSGKRGKKVTVNAIDDNSFKVYEGETFGLVGESGCGKTTTGRTIIRLYNPTAGKMKLMGRDISGPMNKDLRHFLTDNVAMIFQDPIDSLNPRMTVEEIVAEGLKYHGMTDASQRREVVLEMLNKVGLTHEHASRYPHEFSGGQRQRIGIARALAMEPQFVVCDEPVSALDVSIQAQVINMFDELQEKMGLTYLFIAHDLLVVRHISDRIAVMYLGKMVELADSKEIYDHPLHPYTKSLMSAVPLPDPRKARENKRIVLSGDIPSPLNAPSGCPFRTRCPHATAECAEAMPEFKEVATGHFVACHHVDKIN